MGDIGPLYISDSDDAEDHFQDYAFEDDEILPFPLKRSKIGIIGTPEKTKNIVLKRSIGTQTSQDSRAASDKKIERLQQIIGKLQVQFSD